MSYTPIFDQPTEEVAEEAMREAMGENYNCPACYLEAKGWGGYGCCEICDMTNADHTCAA